MKSYSIPNAEIGQLWELDQYWHDLMGDDGRLFLLVRRVGDTDVWDALCIDSGRLITVTLSNLLYERVA